MHNTKTLPRVGHLAQHSVERAYVTTITNQVYYKGLKVLIKTLRQTKTTIPIFVMLPTNVEVALKDSVRALNVTVTECDPIEIPSDSKEANIMSHWNQTFFKLNVFRLTQFRKIIYIDADMLVLQNIDHLFEYPSITGTTGGKAAHPEWHEFNSGLLVIAPDQLLFEQMVACINPAIERRKALGLGYGDQDVVNQFYPNWHNEPEHNFGEQYNAECPFLDALMQQQGFHNFSAIYVLHYIGAKKIWQNSLLTNLRIIRGCFCDKKPFEARAYLLYLRHLYL